MFFIHLPTPAIFPHISPFSHGPSKDNTWRSHCIYQAGTLKHKTVHQNKYFYLFSLLFVITVIPLHCVWRNKLEELYDMHFKASLDVLPTHIKHWKTQSKTVISQFNVLNCPWLYGSSSTTEAADIYRDMPLTPTTLLFKTSESNSCFIKCLTAYHSFNCHNDNKITITTWFTPFWSGNTH
jgi:hypothetical protein